MVPEILSIDFKYKSWQVTEILSNYFRTKIKGLPQILSNYLKNKIRDNWHSFKLTKHTGFPRFFQILSGRVPRVSFKLLQKKKKRKEALTPFSITLQIRQIIPQILSNYSKNKTRGVAEIPSNYFKNKTQGIPKILSNYFSHKVEMVSEILSNYFKN